MDTLTIGEPAKLMAKLPYLREGSGPVLVLVHGYLGGSAQWKREIAHFKNHFDVIAPDLPGFGVAADFPGCDTIAEMAKAVCALLDGLDVKAFVLLGHSMGGMIAQQIAADRPKAVLKLILYSTGPLGLMPDRFEPIETSRQRLRAEGVARTIERIGATWLKAGSSGTGFALLLELGAQANAQAAMAALAAMEHWDGRDALSSMHMPTLVIWGDSDQSYRWSQVQSLWTGIPNAQLSVVPNTAHALHLEKPELFKAILSDFLCVGLKQEVLKA